MPDSLDPDGCGVIRYGSGAVLAIISRVDGTKSGQFFDDVRTDGEPPQLLAGFRFGGGGFANYRSGQQRFVCTADDVLVAGEDGEIISHFRWDKAQVTAPLPKPIELQLNSVMTLRCTSQANMGLTIKLHGLLVLELGRPVRESYLNKVRSRRVDGSLELDIPRPTLVERQRNTEETPTKKAQRYNWHLPRVSASGREVDHVHVRSHLQSVVDTNKSLVLRLRSYTTSIGHHVQDEVALQRSIPTRSFFSPIKRQQSYVPSAKVPKPQPQPKTLPRLHPRFLDQLVQRMRSTQLLVVLCSDLSTTDCIHAERMLAKIEHVWAADDAAGGRSGVDDDGLRPHSAFEDPAPDRIGGSKRIVLADCSTSNLLGGRHNFRVYPMYLMYYGGQLGFCSNTFNGFGRAEADFFAQVKATTRNCQRNQFLPPTFRFPSLDDPTK
ncbi:hypothetical protein ACHHYP_14836 [Achlya hypogyna]|uniref:FAM194 C-terminal domain-containing protein n=1 Tax=Achlya hypogyna TaxID=1202772 RepID=A0A1V9YCB1_ACHHY|nr:hypothetical protein ACHHYP_14836 [Achlya hypogyna]